MFTLIGFSTGVMCWIWIGRELRGWRDQWAAHVVAALCLLIMSLGGILADALNWAYFWLQVLGALIVVTFNASARILMARGTGIWNVERTRFLIDQEEGLPHEIAELQAIGAKARLSVTQQNPCHGQHHGQGSSRAAPPPRKAKHRIFDPGEKLSSGSALLVFTYIDVDGVVTKREISPWTEYDDHICGFCHLALSERTFRKDRIEHWHKGIDSLLAP